MQDPYYQGVAAQVAFFFMLSIVPTLILVSQLLSLINISLEEINDYFNIGIAPDIISDLREMLKLNKLTSTNIALFIAAIWAASRLQFTLMRVSNYTISEGRDPGTFLRDRGRSIITMIITILAMVVVIVVLVYGQLIIKFLSEYWSFLNSFTKVWTYLRWPAAWALYLLLISFNYYVLPHQRGKFRSVLPGGIFCAVGMLLVTMLYSYYTEVAVSNNILYGSMASFAALMIWFYLISWVIILGIFFNKVWGDTKVKS